MQMQGYLELSRYPDKENVEKYVQKVCFAWCCSVFIRESMLRCRVSQQVRFDTCNLWQRIRELGADPDLLGYVWDGGSSYEYVQPDKNVGSGLSLPDGQLALTTLPHNRLAASASESPSARCLLCGLEFSLLLLLLLLVVVVLLFVPPLDVPS